MRTSPDAGRGRPARHSRPRAWLAAAMAACAFPAVAQDYPTRPVRIILPSAPGGSTDLVARLVAGHLTERLGRQFTVDNRAGAGGTLGPEIALAAPADGYTLLVMSIAQTINPRLYKLKYDITKDFTAVALFGTVASALVVHPSVPAASVTELIALASAKPGRIHFGHAGVGTFQHLATASFARMAGIDIVEVPFKGGGPALVDVLGGHSEVLISALIASLPHIRSGKLRVLGVSGASRHPLLPDVATIAEAGVPGYAAVNWFGLVAPKGTPGPVVERLHREVAAALATDAAREQLAKDAAEIVSMTSAEFGAFIAAETDRWGRVVQAAGITVQ